MFLSSLVEKGVGIAGSNLMIYFTRCIQEDLDSSLVLCPIIHVYGWR